MDYHLTLVASPHYPQAPFFQLVDPEPLQHSDNLRIFKYHEVRLPIGTDLSTMREQVSAMVVNSRVRLSDILAGAIQFVPMKYTERVVGKEDWYNHLYVPNHEGVISEIIVQAKTVHDTPSNLYQVTATLASSLAYEADAPIVIHEWRWFSIRRDGIHVRRDFRSVPEESAEIGWEQLQRRTAESAHLRGDTLWNRAVAHYHEGLMLALPTYQFLAFFKGYEALHELRANLAKRGFSFDKRRLVLPPDVARALPQFHDRPLQEAFNDLYTPYRHAVAHKGADDKEGNPVFVHSDLFNDGQVNYALLAVVVKMCFRELADVLRTATPPTL